MRGIKPGKIRSDSVKDPMVRSYAYKNVVRIESIVGRINIRPHIYLLISIYIFRLTSNFNYREIEKFSCKIFF